jgi:hypothetical protein
VCSTETEVQPCLTYCLSSPFAAAVARHCEEERKYSHILIVVSNVHLLFNGVEQEVVVFQGLDVVQIIHS